MARASLLLLAVLRAAPAVAGPTLSIADAIVAIKHDSQGGDAVSTLQQNVFGVTAYEGGDIFESDNGTEWVKEWGVEMVGFPLSLGGYNMPQPLLPNGSAAKCPGPRNVTEAELRAWWDPDGGHANSKFVDGLWPSPTYPWGRWLPRIAAGAEPFVYLLDNTWGNGNCDTCLGGPPRNATLWGVANGLAMQLAMKAAPSIRYAHLGNEPNAGWFREVPHDTGEVFAAFFAEASLGVKSVVGEAVQIGGPVLCWGPLDGYNGLSQWGWFSSLMDKSLRINRSPPRPDGFNALQFVDFHAYSNGEENANRVVAEIHMVAAYAATRHGVHMPSAITETSVAFASAANWSDHSFHFRHRALPRVRQMMALLEHPDKMLTVQEHDLQANAGAWYTFNGCSNLSTSCATPEMEVFRAFRPLRGHRLERVVTGVDDATMDVRFEASLNLQHGTFGAVVIAAANFGGEPQPLSLQLAEGWKAYLDDDLAPWSAVIVDSQSLRPWPRPRPSLLPNGSVAAVVELPAESLVVLTLPLSERHVPPTVRTFVESFSPAVGVPIDNTSSRQPSFNTTIILPHDLTGATPRLRFGVKGAAVACDSWQIRLDESYELEWKATAEFRGGGCRANPSNGHDFNCSHEVAQGQGIGFAEVELHGWTPPSTPAPGACQLSQAGEMWGGAAISIDPWEMAQYVGLNASQCCEMCRAAVAPACVAFRNDQNPMAKPPADPRLRTDVCRLLSAHDPSADKTVPGAQGKLVHSGAPVRRQVSVSLRTSCDSDAALTPTKKGDISYLAFVSLLMT